MSSYPQNLEYANESSMNEVARQYLKIDLLKGQGDKFDGSPQKFWGWYGYINSRIIEAKLHPMDIIHVLKANTRVHPSNLFHIISMLV